MASADGPVLAISFDGSPVQWAGRRLWIESLTPFTRDGVPSMGFRVSGGTLADAPAEFTGRSVNLTMDTGSGPVSIFQGRVVDDHSSFPRALSTSYRCLGLRYLGDRVPHTDYQTGSDASRWNLQPDDPQYDAGRAGRTLGQILTDCLSMPDNMAGLDAYGIGGYVSTSGYGAAAVAGKVSGGILQDATVTNGGSGYDPANPPNVVFIGGGGTSVPTGTAEVDGTGKVTAVNLADGGSGLVSQPAAVISPLPVRTLLDLAALDFVVPYPVTIQGEALLSAVEGQLRSSAPFCCLHVDHATGYLRFLDQKKFGSGADGYGPTVTLYLNRASDRIDLAGFERFRTVEHAYGRTKARGAPYTECKLLQTKPLVSGASDGGLFYDDAHDGLTSDEAHAKWKLADWTQPTASGGQAVLVATVDGTSKTITGISVQSAGYGYTSAPPVTITGDGTGAAAHAVLGANGGVGSVKVDNAGSNYTTASVSVAAPGGAGGDTGTCTCPDTTHVTLHSSDPTKTWGAGALDQTAGGTGAVIWLQSGTAPGITSSVSRRVVASEAMTAGGSATVQVDLPLPDTSYSAYSWRAPSGGGSAVWRKLAPSDAEIAGKLAAQFSYAVPAVYPDGNISSLTNFPVCLVQYSSSGDPPYVTEPLGIALDAEGGFWLTDKPVVTLNGTQDNLEKGGDSTDGIPDNVLIFAAVYTGALGVASPPDSGGAAVYGGTASTVYGLDETGTVTVPTWRDPANSTAYQGYADSVQESVQDAILELTVPVLKFDPRAVVVGSALCLADDRGTPTGLEDANVPLTDVEVSFAPGRGYWAKTTFKASNRKLPFSASQFERPDRTSLAVGYPLDMMQGGAAAFSPGLPDYGYGKDGWHGV